jgi:hypothetical protein
LKLKSLVTVFFAVYIISLSFIPLVHDTLLARDTWLGYGTGAYEFQGQNYYVLFNDPSDGSSKPHVLINPSFAPNDRIDLLEFSDWTSYVNGFNFFNDFNATTRVSNPQTLDVTYSRPAILIHKYVTVAPNQTTVQLTSEKEFTAHLELWKWVMTSVNGITIAQAPKPMLLPVTTDIEFTFQDARLQSPGVGRIVLSRIPVQIEIWPFENGFNKITVDFVNSEMTLTVFGAMTPIGRTQFVWNYSDLPYVLPVIAVFVVAVYLMVDRHGKTTQNRASRSRD